MSIIDAATFFGRTLLPTVQGSGGASRRVPFTFTSTKRLRAVNAAGSPTDTTWAALSEQDRVNQELQAVETGAFVAETAGTLGLSSLVSSFNILPLITMAVNPNSIKWSQPKRFVKRDTQDGSVFFHFTNSKGQNNDILTLSFSGNTGNINTQNGIDVSTAVGADLKLRIWHDLYNLTREPIILGGTLKNDFFITYKSVIMPIPITFIGFFNQVLEFTDDAANPFAKNYTFSFTVSNTSPDLDTLVDQLSDALGAANLISGVRSITG